MAYSHTVRKTFEGQVAYRQKRDEQIVAYFSKGWSLNELAEKYHLTPQRVGQIIRSNTRRTKKRA